ncbi:MAG: hypothetical protein ACKVLH_03655 [Bacteroidia bacterium]
MLVINGMPDHIHISVKLSRKLSGLVREIKNIKHCVYSRKKNLSS